MSEEEIKDLVERYNRDSSITYDLSDDELQTLLSEVGEMEPIIDEIELLSSAKAREGEPEGVVWVILRK